MPVEPLYGLPAQASSSDTFGSAARDSVSLIPFNETGFAGAYAWTTRLTCPMAFGSPEAGGISDTLPHSLGRLHEQPWLRDMREPFGPNALSGRPGRRTPVGGCRQVCLIE